MRGKDEALVLYLIAVWGLWGTELYNRIPNNVYISASGLRALGIAADFSLIASAIGGLFYLLWPSSHVTVAEEPVKESRTFSEVMDRLHYQAKVREEIRQIRIELEYLSYPLCKDIQFHTWNDTVEHTQKDSLINNETHYKAIQFFSTALNNRNKQWRQVTPHYEDRKFVDLNQKCIGAYNGLQGLSFLEKSDTALVVVTPADADSQKLKWIRIALKDGSLKVPARFDFVTVKNLTGPPVKDLEADFVAPHAGSGSLLMIWSTGRDYLTVHEEDETIEEFRDRKNALRYDMAPKHMHSNEVLTTLVEGDERTFAIVFTNEDVAGVSIPSLDTIYMAYFSSSAHGFRFDLYLKGTNLPRRRVASFMVVASDVESLNVTPMVMDGQEAAVPAPEALREIALRFWVSSTSDWFDIGIENGKLVKVTKQTMKKGKIDEISLHDNYFQVKHGSCPSLVGVIKATFRIPNKPICVLRKGDTGNVKVEIDTVPSLLSISRYLNGLEYLRSPKDKNEVTFELIRT